jgi:DNA-directed RNA polymerase subunit F
MSTERYVPLIEIKEMMEKESKLRELTPEQKISLDHATKMGRGTKANAEKLLKELLENSFISESVAIKIVDIMPLHTEDVRVLFAKERIVLDKKQIEQIIKLVEKYL